MGARAATTNRPVDDIDEALSSGRNAHGGQASGRVEQRPAIR